MTTAYIAHFYPAILTFPLPAFYNEKPKICPISYEGFNEEEMVYTQRDCELTSEITGVRSQTHGSWLMQRLYGKNQWCAVDIDSLNQADPEFLVHLSEQTPAYIHYICLILMAWQRHEVPPYTLARQAEILRKSNQKALLSALYHPYPTGLLNILAKLDTQPLSKNNYRLLLKLLRDPDKCGYLAHVSKIKAYQLMWIEEFPSNLLHWSILHTIKKAQHYASFKYLVKVIEQLDKNKHKDILLSLKRLKTLSQLENWFRRHTLTLHFPDPPWAGNECVVPICTVKALRDAALKYRNCIYESTRQCLLGQYYYYEITHGAAILLLVRDPIIGWRLAEINGINNKPPAETVVSEIKQVLSAANISADNTAEVDELWDRGEAYW